MEMLFRTEWPKLLAILVRDFGDIELAEDCAQDAFIQAGRLWGVEQPVPDRPGAWLTTTARRKALDVIRRSSSYETKLAELEVRAKRGPETTGGTGLVDEQLALLLGCCHPALNLEAQVALTLRLVAGLSTEQIARGFLVDEATMSRRITRAKAKIRSAGIPFRPVDSEVLSERLNAVLHVIYLIFTEGHKSASADVLVRGDLCDEATWLASLLAQLLPNETEVHGLHALILLTDSRRSTRVDDDGLPVMLEDQDRSAWDTNKIDSGLAALSRTVALGEMSTFGLQAVLASIHARAETFESTDWKRIVCTYDMILQLDASPVIALNRAIALSFAEGPEAGLAAIEPLRSTLDGYLYLHSAMGELQSKLGRVAPARASYERALACQPSTAEREFLLDKIERLVD